MSHELTRKTMLERLQEGADEEDWTAFNHFYWGLVTSWARALGCSESVAQDIYQNTVISLHGCLGRFEHSGKPGAFRKWLKTIVKRRVYDYYRWEAKNSESTDSGSKLPSEAIDHDAPDKELDRIWLCQLMDQALQHARHRVSDDKFETFRRYVIYEEAVEEVSAATGVQVATIYQHKNSFLNTLREEFIRLLGDLHDLGPTMRNTDSARKQLKAILAEYIQSRKEFRDTCVVAEPPEVPPERLAFVRKMVGNAPSEPGMHLLILVDESQEWFQPKHDVLIGISEDCDLCIELSGISSRHARLRSVDDEWIIEDLGSTNGTWLNGRKIKEYPLRNGDLLQLAGCSIQVW